jgi:hypothetical protein
MGQLKCCVTLLATGTDATCIFVSPTAATKSRQARLLSFVDFTKQERRREGNLSRLKYRSLGGRSAEGPGLQQIGTSFKADRCCKAQRKELKVTCRLTQYSYFSISETLTTNVLNTEWRSGNRRQQESTNKGAIQFSSYEIRATYNTALFDLVVRCLPCGSGEWDIRVGKAAK